MDFDNHRDLQRLVRLLAVPTLLALALAGCGGGGGGGTGGGTTSTSAGSSASGQFISTGLVSRNTDTDYSLDVYLPPSSAGARGDLPVVYLLDGETWFSTLVDNTQATQNRTIVVGIRSMGVRARDYVPINTCTPDGGGHVAFLNFIRQELIPYIESTFGGSPAKRAIFGHSHGGTFVLYALFAEAPGQHTFRGYLASDSALQCISGAADQWARDYAALHPNLPARLHLSFVAGGQFGTNNQFTDTMNQINFTGLTFVSAPYSGTHLGIGPQSLAEGVPFAFATSP